MSSLWWLFDVLFGWRRSSAYRGAGNPDGPPQALKQMSPEGLPGLSSGLYRSASASGEKMIKCKCGVQRATAVKRCPVCGDLRIHHA
jgi:hypothetical protein